MAGLRDAFYTLFVPAKAITENVDGSIEVDDVDQVYTAAVETGAKIVYDITDEPWGLRRFFLEDPDGNVINVLSHTA